MRRRRVEPIISPANRKQIENYLQAHLSFFIEGGPGIGKSLAIEYLGRKIYANQCSSCAKQADRGCKQCEPMKLDITEDTEVRHLLGETDLIRYFADTQQRRNSEGELRDYFRPGPLPTAMQTGRLLIVEELDRAGRETLFPVFFDAIEYRTVYIPELGATIHAQPTFNIVFTVNRLTDIGTVVLPKALLRRQRSVRFYDPSQELDHNRWHAANCETSIIMRNVEGVLEEKHLSKKMARQAVENLLHSVVFPLRISGSMSDLPTPAETAMWFHDIFSCDGTAFLDVGTSSADKLDIVLTHRGALVKSQVDEPAFVNAVSAYFLGTGGSYA